MKFEKVLTSSYIVEIFLSRLRSKRIICAGCAVACDSICKRIPVMLHRNQIELTDQEYRKVFNNFMRSLTH